MVFRRVTAINKDGKFALKSKRPTIQYMAKQIAIAAKNEGAYPSPLVWTVRANSPIQAKAGAMTQNALEF